MTNNGNIGTTRYVYNYNVLYCTFEDTCTRTCRFRYLNIFQLAEKTASQGWTPALAPRRGTAPRSWCARGDTMDGREVVRAFHWMLWNFKRRGFRERESADAIARFRAPFRRERVKKYSNRRNIYCARCVWEAVTNVIKIFKYIEIYLCFLSCHILVMKNIVFRKYLFIYSPKAKTFAGRSKLDRRNLS